MFSFCIHFLFCCGISFYCRRRCCFFEAGIPLVAGIPSIPSMADLTSLLSCPSRCRCCWRFCYCRGICAVACISVIALVPSVLFNKVSVANPHHFDADPARHFDADLDPDSDPTFHFDVDPDHSFQKRLEALKKSAQISLYSIHFGFKLMLTGSASS